MLRGIVKIFSYLFHLLLALALTGISFVALSSGLELQLDMLPWKPSRLAVWLLVASLAGLVSIALAVIGKLRILFVLWSLVVLVAMVRGFFLGSYNFTGPIGLPTALWLTLAALAASFGAWMQFRKARVG
jgi:hypothetical protein